MPGAPARLVRREDDPETWLCPACGESCPWSVSGVLSDGSRLWFRSRCACEVRSDEQHEARYAAEQAQRVRIARMAFLRQIRAASGIQGRMEGWTFAAFDPGRSASMADAAAKLRAWAEAYQPTPGALGWCLMGRDTGCGKSHLMTAAAACLLTRGVSARVTTVADLLDAMRFDIRNGRDGAQMDHAATVDVLCLDDIGAERVAEGERGDWVRERLFTLLDRRFRAGRPILMTTNLTSSEIEARIGGEHGARIISRLLALTRRWLPVDGPDGRAASVMARR